MSKITLKRISLFFEFLFGDAIGLFIGLAVSAILAIIIVSVFFLVAVLISSFFKAFGLFKCIIWVTYLTTIFLFWVPVFWIWFKMHWQNSEDVKREDIS